MNSPTFLVIDLFCGFGGTTTGLESAIMFGDKVAKVIACVNHDPKAIKSHWLNHPEVKHFEEDIRTLDLTELNALLDQQTALYPEAYVMLWASLECTNFSKAKGGQPRNADSRTLAEHLFRYVATLSPDYILIENVVEFMSWGPLDDAGKPLSRKNGQDWMNWRNQMNSFGYNDDWKELNSADYGAYTSRNRLFGCFAANGLPIAWPSATHSKKATDGMFGTTEKWKAVKHVLNFEDVGESIFGRKTPLVDKTLDRVYAGLVKYVANGDKTFIAKSFSGRPMGKVISTDVPAGTITTRNGQSLVQVEDVAFLSNYKSGHPSSKNTSVETAAGTLTTVPTQALVQASFLLKYNSTNGKTGAHTPPSVEEPAPTVACQARLGIVQPEFLQTYYGNGGTSSPDEPCPTLTTKDRVALVQPTYFIDEQYGNGKPASIDEPASGITTIPKHNLVEAQSFIMNPIFDSKGFSTENPLGVITATRRHWHYLVNPQFGNGGASIDKPCFTLIAKMDKRPPYLVEAEGGEIAIEVYETDSPMTIKIKQFMAAYGLIDIKMRMLRVVELLRIQGFPEDYKMVGNQADAKKFIGNSVVPTVPQKWAEALASKLLERKVKVA